MSSLDISKRFGPYRPPNETTIPKFQKIQDLSYHLALLIEKECPVSEEKSTALILLQQAKMMANAAIALYSNDNAKLD